MCGKRFLVISLVLLLASSWLFAWPSRTSQNQAVNLQTPAEQAVSSAKPITTQSITVLTEPGSSLTCSETAAIADALDITLDQIETGTKASQVYAEALEEEKAELAAVNAEQADTIASQSAKLSSYERMRPFIMLDGIYTTNQDLVPGYGVGLELGLMSKHGFMISVGVDYNIGTFNESPSWSWDVNKFTGRVGIGYMF